MIGTSRDTSRVAPLGGVTFLDLDVAGDASVTPDTGDDARRLRPRRGDPRPGSGRARTGD
ncbi:hypothetical protein STAFG_1202 [Streptomyces afghaniensis 772]|uniref:Uncharacterized protein n=1 Tax=Streptomyces afghaniensis 772 TaxID=1283301 RepID=S4N2Y4_9ACTN|nr:hypothetical protein STAFG_1202 [Streptomyces afghaniensis 772]